MNPLILAQEIIDGRRITRKDDLSFFLTCDLDELCEGADRIREAYIGDKVDLCSIINGRSGRCPEDCKYCAQSVHHHTSCEIYDFLPEKKILEACKMNEEEGVDRFSIVTAGKALTGKEFDQAIHAYETMHKECNIDLCASMGFLSSEQLHRLHEAGVTSYHHNIETSRRNFPNICTTHTYDMKIETLKKVKAEGMCACSGGPGTPGSAVRVLGGHRSLPGAGTGCAERRPFPLRCHLPRQRAGGAGKAVGAQHFCAGCGHCKKG